MSLSINISDLKKGDICHHSGAKIASEVVMYELGRYSTLLTQMANPQLIYPILPQFFADKDRTDVIKSYFKSLVQDRPQIHQVEHEERVLSDEMINFIRANKAGRDYIDNNGTVDLEIIRKLSRIVTKKTRGETSAPGEFRQKRNQINQLEPLSELVGKGYNPTVVETIEADRVEPLMENLIEFYSEETEYPLIQIAFFYAQLHAIHPFMDGNGRICRALVSLMLYHKKLLSAPISQVHMAFKRDYLNYYVMLQAFMINGEPEVWLKYFLEKLLGQTRIDIKKAEKIIRFERDIKVRALSLPGADHSTQVAVMEVLLKSPISTLSGIQKSLKGRDTDKIAASLTNLVNYSILIQVEPKNGGGDPIYAMPELINISEGLPLFVKESQAA